MKAFLVAILIAQAAARTATGNAVITGRILGLDGKPAVQVRVAAAVVSESSRKTEELASITLTDVEGRYHLANLPPGRYRIVAGPLNEPTYFPGAADGSGAKVLELTAVSRLADIDFKLTEPRILKISGGVSRSSVSPDARFVLVRLTGPNGVTTTMANTVSSNSDELLFEFRQIVPGSYRVDIQTGAVAGPVDVTVRDKPVTGIHLGAPLVTIQGTINLEAGYRGRPIPLRFFSTTPGGPEVSRVVVTPTFTVGVPLGEFRVSVSEVPTGYELESFTSGQRDLLREPLLVNEASPPQIDIKLRRTSDPR
jgi:hypothetical protein